VSKVIARVLPALLLICASCGRSNIYPVSGKVTYQGANAPGATVFFYRHGDDSGNEPIITGIVQDDGTFELVCGSQGKGAPPGDYDVLIEWRQADSQSKGRPRRLPDKLNGRYADRKNPLLHATVEARAVQLEPFELTDNGAIQKR
jgi:hypothetical protein